MTDEYTQTVVIDPNNPSSSDHRPAITPTDGTAHKGTNNADPSPDPEFIQTYSYLT